MHTYFELNTPYFMTRPLQLTMSAADWSPDQRQTSKQVSEDPKLTLL